jgi:hypothetical protein
LHNCGNPQRNAPVYKPCDKSTQTAKLVRSGPRVALHHAEAAERLGPRSTPATPFPSGASRMLRPDQYHAILSIMRYGSLVLSMLFAGKIVAYAAAHPF